MLLALLSHFTGRVDAIELFLLNVEVARHFSHGTWHNRQHAILRIAAGGHSGWAEGICGHNKPDVDLAAWGSGFAQIAGRGLSDAIAFVHARPADWPSLHVEMAEFALLDLIGRVANRPAVELLGLGGIAPVPCLFCILESDPAAVRARAKHAAALGLRSHLKLKIFGDDALDCRLIAAAREEMGSSTYLVADANGGYKQGPGDTLQTLAHRLERLRVAGLDACEDPAKLAPQDWVTLQSLVGRLDLLPDAPLRPAWKAINRALPGMGRIYNIHPGCVGSPIDGVELARKIQGFNARLMIGDDSLIGPGCTAWQQLAIGLGAAWVEALEKPDECSVFADAVQSQATVVRNCSQLAQKRAGFGLDINLERLRANASRVALITA